MTVDPVSEITDLFPAGKEVSLKGKVYKIMPFGFGKFPKVLSLVKGFKDPTGGAVTIANLGDLLADNSEAVIELAALATSEKREFFDDLPMDQAIDLMQAVLEVNASFFVSRLQPKILKAVEELTKSLGGK